MSADLCQRTLCIWRPGEPVDGVRCTYAYRGSVPCTGRKLCMTCGREEPIPVLDERDDVDDYREPLVYRDEPGPRRERFNARET